MKCLVEIEPGTWLANWAGEPGDPGKTTLRRSAREFESEWAAKCAIEKARSRGLLGEAMIVAVL
jgi:hypothetical protein